MSWATDSWMRLRSLLSRRDRAEQIENELSTHIDMLARDLEAKGLDPATARSEARRRFGDMRAIRKELYKMETNRVGHERRKAYLDELMQDLRYGTRQLLRNPLFTAIVIGTLAVGVGANTAVFSVFKGVFLDPLPYHEPGRLTYIFHGETDGSCCGPLSGPDFLDLRRMTETFEDMAVISSGNTSLTGDGDPAVVLGARISPSIFSLLGVQPVRGRSFTDEDQLGDGRVAVLSDGLWRQRLGADPNIIGSTIELNGEPHTVVGVLPPGFSVPSPWYLNEMHDIYVPLSREEVSQGRDSHWLLTLGRIKPGVTLEAADAELKLLSKSLEEQYPQTNHHKTTYVFSMHERLVGSVGTQLLLILSAAGFMLLIVCGNVASLLLSRATGRETEMAIRGAVGASRMRIIRQLITESMLLSLLGGMGGFALAFWGMSLLRAVIPADLPRVANIGIDGTVLGFALGLSVLTGLVFGLAPALTATRVNLTDSLKEGKGTPKARSGRNLLRGALVTVQFALALVLANGAALMLQSYLDFRGMEQGFDPRNVLTVNVTMQGERYDDVWARGGFLRQAIQRIGALPGVVAVGAKNRLPLRGGTNSQVWTEDDPERPPSGGPGPLVEFGRVSGDYFGAMGVRLLAGRYLNAEDSVAAHPGTIINEEMARRLWPGENPIGKRYSFREEPPIWMTVVGVVQDVRQWGPYRTPRAEHYLPYTAPGWASGRRMYLIVKTELDPLSIVGAVKEAIISVDEDQAISEVRTMEGVLSDQFAGQRFSTLLVGIFAAIALMLVTAGVYGVVSFYVAQTTHEIGVRMALGAGRGRVLRLTIIRGLKLAAIGGAIGVGGIFATTHVIRSLLFGASPVDIPTMIGGVVILIAVGVLASVVPAHRAASVSPVTALRSE
jgi:predicted permease